jgi:hypothetical protein
LEEASTTYLKVGDNSRAAHPSPHCRWLWPWYGYCALMSKMHRTRYQCAGCGVPLCSIDNRKVEDDCFTIAHETEDQREMVCKKYDKMKKINRRQQQNN